MHLYAKLLGNETPSEHIKASSFAQNCFACTLSQHQNQKSKNARFLPGALSSFSEVVRFFHSYAAAFLFLNLGTEKKKTHGAGEHTLTAAQAKLLDTDLRHCIKRSTKCSELEKNVGVCYLKTSLFFHGLEISLHPTLKREPKHELRHITDDAAMTTSRNTHKAPSAHTLSQEHLFETIAIKNQPGIVPSHSSEADPQSWAA